MKVMIVGAGLAGATAAALLKHRHDVAVFENMAVGGLLNDSCGVQWHGPHAFHTDDSEVWDFVCQHADFQPFNLCVFVQTDPQPMEELPRRASDDRAFRVYSEKAWGKPFDQLPDFIRSRVPGQCTDGRVGYHAGKYKGQPVGGYSRMIGQMLEGVQVEHKSITYANQIDGAVIFTGNINDYAGTEFPWVGRRWTFDTEHKGHVDGVHIINHATHLVPQLRTYDLRQINPYHAGLGVAMEHVSNRGVPCYPSPDVEHRERADKIILDAKKRNHWLCGRMGTYRYLDMDKTIRNVMDTLKEAGLC